MQDAQAVLRKGSGTKDIIAEAQMMGHHHIVQKKLYTGQEDTARMKHTDSRLVKEVDKVI